MGANERSYPRTKPASQRAERPYCLVSCAQLWRESFREKKLSCKLQKSRALGPRPFSG